jgi:hypothetical protein
VNVNTKFARAKQLDLMARIQGNSPSDIIVDELAGRPVFETANVAVHHWDPKGDPRWLRNAMTPGDGCRYENTSEGLARLVRNAQRGNPVSQRTLLTYLTRRLTRNKASAPYSIYPHHKNKGEW